MQDHRINIKDSHLGKFNTYLGREIDLLNPTVENIDIVDIAHALGNICRFGGHCAPFYSVAQHSVLVAALAPQELKLTALLHDAAEAYLGDVIKPLKIMLAHHYTQFEKLFDLLISLKYKLSSADMAAIKVYDQQALELEHEALQLGEPQRLRDVFRINMLPYGYWRPDQAELEFLTAFQELYRPEEIPMPHMAANA